MFLAGIALAAGLLQAANAQNCSDYTFVNHFNSSSEWKTNFERTSSRGLGLIKAAESGEGNTFTITTSEAGSVTLRSYAWFMPPAKFEWDIAASDEDGVMSALTVWSGYPGGTPEIDLEMQGWSERRDTVMHPIWHEGHGDDPIGLSDAPEGWPSSNGGPKANYKNGFTPESNNRYVVNQTDFDNTARHVYSLDWQEDSMTWYIDGTEMVTFTKGDDDSLWPNGPLPISVGIWAAQESQAEWMGEYTYNKDAPPVMNVYRVSAQGCSTNTTEELVKAAKDSAISLNRSPFLALSALVAVTFWMFA